MVLSLLPRTLNSGKDTSEDNCTEVSSPSFHMYLMSLMVYPKLSSSREHSWLSEGKYCKSIGQLALIVILELHNTSPVYSTRIKVFSDGTSCFCTDLLFTKNVSGFQDCDKKSLPATIFEG